MSEFPTWQPSRLARESLQPETITVAPVIPMRARWGSLAWAFVIAGALGAAIWRWVPEPAPSVDIEAVAAPSPAFPIRCEPGGSVSLRSARHSVAGTLIEAARGCRVVIENSELEADRIVIAEEGADIIVSGSRLSARGHALRLGARSAIAVKGKSAISAGEDAIIAGEGSAVTTTDSTIEGRSAALRVATGSRWDASRSRLSSKEVGVHAGDSFKLNASELVVEAGKIALFTGSLLQAALVKSRLEAQQTALRTGLGANVTVSDESVLAGGTETVAAGARLHFTAEHSKIRGTSDAISVEGNASITLRDLEMIEAKRGIVSGGSLELNLESVTLRASSVGVCAAGDAKIHARSSTIASRDALRLPSKPDPSLLKGTRIDGAIVVSRDCALAPELAAKTQTTALAAVPHFDYARAAAELNRATRAASTTCRSQDGRTEAAIVIPSFTPDGRNAAAFVRNADEIGSAAACVLHYFQRIRVPVFDPSEQPREMMRVVSLKR